MKDSIQDYLTSLGFTIEPEQECFVKYLGNLRVAIPFADIVGKTVQDFILLAREKGWAKEQQQLGLCFASDGVIENLFTSGLLGKGSIPETVLPSPSEVLDIGRKIFDCKPRIYGVIPDYPLKGFIENPFYFNRSSYRAELLGREERKVIDAVGGAAVPQSQLRVFLGDRELTPTTDYVRWGRLITLNHTVAEQLPESPEPAMPSNPQEQKDGLVSFTVKKLRERVKAGEVIVKFDKGKKHS